MQVTIAGLGLIGGSLGKVLRKAGWRVRFVDPAVSMEQARAAGAADETGERLDGELVVLATPADVAIRLLGMTTAALVTSVSSVIVPLRRAAGNLNFVGGHPFAGSEQSGLAAARNDLFAGRPWFIDRDDPVVRELIAAAGAEPVVVDGEEHDRIMALTSHLPQVLSTALASLLDGIDPRFIGSGARSTLRLAGSSYDVWQPVLENNDANISAAAQDLWRAMQNIGAEEFANAQRFYRSLNRGSGEPPER